MLTHRYFRVAVAISLAVALAAPAAARKCRGMPNYDPDTETTISGTVEKISEQECRKGCRGIHLWLVNEADTYEVHVGPSHFLKTKNFQLVQGDELSIIGSPVPGDASGALIARQIDRDTETLTLRDERGIPQWRGSGRSE